ncbi:helix-turn-helix domain-containing protein [Pararhodospirillum oryzae]|uniref:HTH cro/C1-type domain-containing protein n=1 Tax=Pararhodospirillum oryzae TaxID=478448 RepID=A0A512H5Z9_9PROT|nr:helix-turn-helix domain-containing protein [Pararhodospirillum oryzae]GEO80810.1 hypothetical protein ROR02_09410 [Pararhodospirillum oryzae]
MEILPEYQETMGGMIVVIKNAVIREVCEACGETTFEMPDSPGLAKAVALVRALNPLQLSGKDVRFIRKALEMNGRQFAEAMEVTPETISRWEQGEKGIGGYSEKLLRHNVCALLHKAVPTLRYDQADIVRMKIIKSDDAPLPRVVFERVVVRDRTEDEGIRGWDKAAA